MYICAVHFQVLQKSKTVCFTSCSKGTYVILPFEQKLWSSFPAEDDFSTVVSLTQCVELYRKSQEKVSANPCLGWKKLLCGPFEEALDWLITRETEQNCEADGQEQKAILVWGEISHFSSISRCCYWTDKWNLLLLEKGKVCHWGRHTIHTLSVEHLRSWVKMRKSRSADFPAELYPHSKISKGKNYIWIHFSSLYSSGLYNMV